MSKPKSEMCDKCYIKNNDLRCMTCKHKTNEWVVKYKSTHPVMMLGEHDHFIEKRRSADADNG